MRHSLRWLLLAGLAAAALIAGCSEQPLTPGQDTTKAPLINNVPGAEYIDGSYMVVFKDDVKDVDAVIGQMADKAATAPTYRYTAAIKGFAARMTPEQVEALRSDSRVAWIEQDAVIRLETTQTGATWGIDRIDQADLPLDSSYTYNYDGTGVKAYIIDTGIKLTHTDFGGRAILGVDEISSSNGGVDQNGHGTHVSGTVGGTTYGVAKNVTLVAVRVLDASGSGTTTGVVAGIDWVTSNHASGELAVANMSLGGSASTTLDTAVSNSIADGVCYSVAAGNEGAAASTKSPARVAAALTVGAFSSSDVMASWSNYGSTVDLLAPGVNIKSDYYSSTTATATMSGTSMASPHVCGATALYLQANPTATPATIHSAIVSNATANTLTVSGTGTPNLALYTGFIGGGGGTAPSAPTLSSPTNGATSVSVTPTLSWSASSGATSYGWQVATDSAFSAVVQSGTASGTSVTLSTLSNSTTYYWRVNASNSYGTSAYSSVYSFTTVASGGSAPSAPTLSSPSNGATNVSRTPTLVWNASSGATSYTYNVSTSSTFSTIARSGTVTTTSVTISSSLGSRTRYYWRVNASNSYGTSAWSSSRYFTTRR